MAFTTKTIFDAKDKVSNVFTRMSQNATRFGRSSSKAFKKASTSAKIFSSITKSILSSAALIVSLSTLTAGLGTVTQEFISFDQAITSSSAKFKGLDLTTQAGLDTLLKLKTTAREVGAVTQFSAGEAAQGLDFLAMAGFNAEQAMASLGGVVNLATVADVDLARATDIASDSLGAFGLMTQDTIKLQKNFTRVNDVMAKTMTSTNTNMEDLFEAVKKGAPTFTASGQSLESFNALLGTLANSGLKGSDAGTSLRNVMLRLATATPKAQKVMDSLGVVTKDSQGNFRDVLDILGDVEKGLKGMGTAQRTTALATIFGARTVTGINILMGEGTDKIREFREELLGAGGASQIMADIMRKSLGNRLKSLKSAAIELGFKLFEAFEKRGGNAIETMTQAIRNFDPKPIIAGINTAVKVMSALFAVVQPFIPVLPILIKGWLVYASVMKGIQIAQRVQAFFSFFLVLQKMVGTVGILNALFMANPLGAVIFAVTAAIALFVILEKKFKLFSTAWTFWSDLFVSGLKFLDAGLMDLSTSIAKVFSFFGLLGERGEAGLAKNQEAPNKEEIRSSQEISFRGQLDIAGAPEGSTVKSTTRGAPGIQVDLLGAS